MQPHDAKLNLFALPASTQERRARITCTEWFNPWSSCISSRSSIREWKTHCQPRDRVPI